MEKYDLFVNEPENAVRLKFVRVTVYEKIGRNIRNYWYVLSIHTHTYSNCFIYLIKPQNYGHYENTIKHLKLLVW